MATARPRRVLCRPRRPGNTILLAMLMMMVMFALLAFSVDTGYLLLTRTQLQRSADAAAMAAAWDMLDQKIAAAGNTTNTSSSQQASRAHQVADQFATLNNVGNVAPRLAFGDVSVGYLENPSDSNAQLVNDPSRANAVRVLIRRAEDQNGQTPLFFARVMGFTSLAQEATATASFADSFRGLRAPTGGGNLDFLPLALDRETFYNLLAGIGSDLWSWNSDSETIGSGSDGIKEANLFPQGTGSPGNRGTVDIGSNNNSTADLSRQIRDGVTPADLAYHGGKLEFNSDGKLFLNGDTGISAAIKDDLAAIKGKSRIIPLFTQVAGNGNNAYYTIVEFAAVRILDVDLTGSKNNKRVIIQPAPMVFQGGIPQTSGGTSVTTFMYSPISLSR